MPGLPQRLQNALLDTLYPRKCGLCGRFAEVAICPYCEAEFIPDDSGPETHSALTSAHALFRYEGRAAQAVQRLKYERARPLALPMATKLAASVEAWGIDPDAIVPVPMHWVRQMTRGFNQADLLTREMPRNLVQNRWLTRIRATTPQARLSPEARQSNLVGAFHCNERLVGELILLVDDVATSGHTAQECAKTLLEAGAGQVHLAVFAAG